ncbi:MAG: hypothetical protein ACM3WV_03715 [Bacillota bacterium]
MGVFTSSAMGSSATWNPQGISFSLTGGIGWINCSSIYDLEGLSVSIGGSFLIAGIDQITAGEYKGFSIGFGPSSGETHVLTSNTDPARWSINVFSLMDQIRSGFLESYLSQIFPLGVPPILLNINGYTIDVDFQRKRFVIRDKNGMEFSFSDKGVTVTSPRGDSWFCPCT